MGQGDGGERDDSGLGSAPTPRAASDPQTPATGPPASSIITVVVADDRPVVRAGFRTVLDRAQHDGAAIRALGGCTLQDLPAMVVRRRPTLIVAAARENDAAAFRALALARQHHPAVRSLAVVDRADMVGLRQAVLAGVDSVLLSDAVEQELLAAVVATCRGQRVVSPHIAMELAGNWHQEEQRVPADSSLTRRELEVLQLLAEGMTNQELGRRLGLSPRTIKTHVQNLLAKLEVRDRTGAVAQGFRRGLIR